MTHQIKTSIQHIDAKPGQRILAVSDIHGHLDRLIQLLRLLHYRADDILVIVGDLIEKGPESLRVVQYVMDRDILRGEYFGCHPCMNTSSIRLRMRDLLDVFLPAVGHEPLYVELTGE